LVGGQWGTKGGRLRGGGGEVRGMGGREIKDKGGEEGWEEPRGVGGGGTRDVRGG